MGEGRELMQVDEIIDTRVDEGGKRLYHVKWMPIWVSGEQLPIENAEGEKATNDGVYVLLDERKNEEGVVEYLLSYSSTWEPEKKLIASCPDLLSSFWSSSHVSGIIEVNKVDEDQVTSQEFSIHKRDVVIEDDGYTMLKHGKLNGGKHIEHEKLNQVSFEEESSKLLSNDYRPLFSSLSDMHDKEHIYGKKYSPDGKNIGILAILPKEKTEFNDDKFGQYNDNFSYLVNPSTDEDLDLKRSTVKFPKKRLCETCGKYFSTKSNLNRHRKKCDGGRLFYCEICGENFSMSFSLILHQRSHTKELFQSGNGKSRNGTGNIWNDPVKSWIDNVEVQNEDVNSQCGKVVSQDNDIISQSEDIISRNENLISQSSIISRNENLISPSDNIISQSDKIISHNENLISPSKDIITRNENLISESDKINSRNDNLISQNDTIVSPNNNVICWSNKISQNENVSCHSSNRNDQSNKIKCSNNNIKSENSLEPNVKPRNNKNCPYKTEDNGDTRGISRDNWGVKKDLQNNKKKSPDKTNPWDNNNSSKQLMDSYTLSEYQRVPHTTSYDRKYKCDKCWKQFSTKSNLNRHCKTCSVSKLFKCEVCGASFAKSFQLKIHENLHMNEKVPVNERFYPCNVCGQVCSSSLALNKHLEIHDERRFVNNMKHDIDKKLSTNPEHEKFEVREKPYKSISLNNASTAKLSNTFSMKDYQQESRGKRIYDCKKCAKRFSTKSNLNRHVKNCSGGKVFNCNVCSLPFARSVNLKIHQKTHTNDNRYQCNVCKKQCLTSYALLEHERVHTGVRPFKCDNCGRQFTTKSNWKRHQVMYSCKKMCIPQNTDKTYEPGLRDSKRINILNIQNDEGIKNDDNKDHVHDLMLQPLQQNSDNDGERCKVESHDSKTQNHESEEENDHLKIK